MPEMIKTISERIEKSLESALTNEERKKIALHIGAVSMAGGLLIIGKIHQRLFPGYESITGIIMLSGAVIAGYPIFKKAVTGFAGRNSKHIMEQLVSLALLASLAIGDYQTVILIPLIISLVHLLEERSILGAESAIDGLKTLQVKEACLVIAEGEIAVKSESLKSGDIIRVRPGDMIPTDGEIIEGKSSINQSSLTGETVPKDVGKGDHVYAGTINIQGFLKVRVIKNVNETSLHQIVELLKQAEQSRTETMRIIERYSAYYLPLIIIIAAGVLFITQDLHRMIAIFVVSCPCAQVLVSSTAMVAALAVSSRNGILIKNSAFLEVLGNVKTVIFDKTGTLTVGSLEVMAVNPEAGVTAEELKCIAASAAWASKHPVSRAIVRAVQKLPFEKAISIEESAGFGLEANTSKGRVLLGKRSWLESNNLILPGEPKHYGPVVWAGCDNKVLGHILLADYLRPDAKKSIQALRELGIKRVILVTGDQRESTDAIKTELCLDEAFAGCLPSDKLEIVKREMEHQGPIMVVGDGINDALALVKADVGVAMGAMGSDIAIQSADIALMGNELEKLSFVIKLSRKTKIIIYQNMAIAALSSGLMLLLAGMGIITSLLGSLLHNIGAFVVLVNSARLLRFESEHSPNEKNTDGIEYPVKSNFIKFKE
jgi:Cd2+/Zn2+-exporting ATPase